MAKPGSKQKARASVICIGCTNLASKPMHNKGANWLEIGCRKNKVTFGQYYDFELNTPKRCKDRESYVQRSV